jgi:predicted metal-binding membrane protein
MSDRALLQSGVLLAAAAAAAWAGLLALEDEMPMGAGLWLGAWTVMMAAMMIPSASPLVLLYARASSLSRTGLLTSGYLLTWAGVGVAAYLLDMRLPAPSDAAVASVLVGAGIYQFTPLKHACLKHCRRPADFLMTRWRAGHVGAFRLGLEHGAFCIGCCWALMAVLVVAGAMGLIWVVAIALAIAAEKLLPAGPLLGRLGGVALIVAGIVVAL